MIFKDWNARNHNREGAGFSSPYDLTKTISKFVRERAEGAVALLLHARLRPEAGCAERPPWLPRTAALLSERQIQANNAGIRLQPQAYALPACNFGLFALNASKTSV